MKPKPHTYCARAICTAYRIITYRRPKPRLQRIHEEAAAGRGTSVLPPGFKLPAAR